MWRVLIPLVLVACTPAVAPRMEVLEVVGTSAEHVEATAKPALAAVRRHCAEAQGGKIVLRVLRVDGKTRVFVAPGSSLDPTLRACANDALVSVDLPEAASNAGAPEIPPSGFTALVTVAW